MVLYISQFKTDVLTAAAAAAAAVPLFLCICLHNHLRRPAFTAHVGGI